MTDTAPGMFVGQQQRNRQTINVQGRKEVYPVSKELTEAKRRAIKKYDANNTRQVHLKLNIKTDADILDHLEKQESVQGYIKRLIREDMTKQTTHKGCLVANGVPIGYWCYNCEMDVSENDSFCPYCKMKFISK